MREWRKTHPLTEEQRVKARVRNAAGVYKRRGVIVVQPCNCGSTAKLEMHHPDYSQRKNVVFMCREHHLEHHV